MLCVFSKNVFPAAAAWPKVGPRKEETLSGVAVGCKEEILAFTEKKHCNSFKKNCHALCVAFSSGMFRAGIVILTKSNNSAKMSTPRMSAGPATSPFPMEKPKCFAG